MKLFRLPKLNSLGSSHIVLVMAVVVGIGIVGAYELVGSHAATPPLSPTSHVQCSAVGRYNNETSHKVSSLSAANPEVYGCHWFIPAPVYDKNGTNKGTFHLSSSNWIICQMRNTTGLSAGYERLYQRPGTSDYNSWWGLTESDSASYGWVSLTYATTGGNDGNAANVPVCPSSSHAYGFYNPPAWGKTIKIPTASTGGTTSSGGTTSVSSCTSGNWYTTGSGGGSTYYSCVNGKWTTASCPTGYVTVSHTSQTGPCVRKSTTSGGGGGSSGTPISCSTPGETVAITGGTYCKYNGSVKCKSGYHAAYSGSTLTCVKNAHNCGAYAYDDGSECHCVSGYEYLQGGCYPTVTRCDPASTCSHHVYTFPYPS